MSLKQIERAHRLRVEVEDITYRFQRLSYELGSAGHRFRDGEVCIRFVQNYLGPESVRRIARAYAAGKVQWLDQRRPSRSVYHA